MLDTFFFVRDNWAVVVPAVLILIGVFAFAYVTRSWKLLLEGIAGVVVLLFARRISSKGAQAERDRQRAYQEKAVARTTAAKESVDDKSDEQVLKELLRDHASDRGK